MKKILAIILISMVGHANADFYADGDTFDWGGFSWTTGITPSDNNDGYVADGAEAIFPEVQIVGSDTGTTGSASTSITSTSASAGTLSVSWDYFTVDVDASWDPFVWLYDGGTTTITDDALTGNQVGIWTIDIAADTLFGFAINSLDNLLGGGDGVADVVLTGISFTADTGGNPGGDPSAVPIPPAFLLFGTALAGFGFMRKKKAAA